MLENNIFFFLEDVEYEGFDDSDKISFLLQVAEIECVKIGFLNYIFCSDLYLLELNKKYLSHDFFTDILTFDSSESKGIVSGDIFISIDRAKENAKEYNVGVKEEVTRLIIHGLMHLVGYRDETVEEKLIMRKKEDYYLSLFPKDK